MSDPPNILLIMADQFRWDAIAAHGNPAIHTPNLDRLVNSGVTFSRAYTESPVCVPARAALMTGLLPFSSGVVNNDTPLADGSPTFIRDLADAGYACHAVGKMHFTPPRASHGLHQALLSEEIPASLDEDDYLQYLVTAGYDHVREPHGVRHELYYSPQPSQLPETAHSTAWTGRESRRLLVEHAGQNDRPLFLWTSFIKPHPPFDPPHPWYLRYDPLAMPDPVRHPRELENLPFHSRAQHRAKWTDTGLSDDQIRTIRAYYYASVSHVDAEIGKIIDTVEDLGLRERTLIVFTADHGEYLGDHWTFGKRGFHDAAARIPLIMSMPATLPEGTVVDSLAGLTDIAPTVLGMATVPCTRTVDGYDLTPVAHGGPSPRERLFGQFQSGPLGVYAAISERHKYVWSAPDQRESLFAIGSDETADLVADPGYGHVVAALRSDLLAELRRHGYTEPLDGPAWRRFPAPELPGGAGDRDPDGRGRQYPVWGGDDIPHPVPNRQWHG